MTEFRGPMDTSSETFGKPGGPAASYLRDRKLPRAQHAAELHERVCGLILAALTDASSLDQNLLPRARIARDKVDRIRESLSAAIDMMYRIDAESFPAPRSKPGLIAALDGLFESRCSAAGITYVQELPGSEPPLHATRAIALFRFFEQTLSLACRSSRFIAFHAAIDPQSLTLTLAHDGASLVGRRAERTAWASMTSGVHLAGGTLAVTSPAPTETFRAVMPI